MKDTAYKAATGFLRAWLTSPGPAFLFSFREDMWGLGLLLHI